MTDLDASVSSEEVAAALLPPPPPLPPPLPLPPEASQPARRRRTRSCGDGGRTALRLTQKTEPASPPFLLLLHLTMTLSRMPIPPPAV